MTLIQNQRDQIRAARRVLASEIRAKNNAQICQRISKFDSYKSAVHVAGYLAFDGEADPMKLMVSAVEQGKQVFLPIIVNKIKPLVFARWTSSTTMKKNQFNILEPIVDPSELVSADQLDFVITPLVGFDDQCNRIGMGGGFYDRSFAFLNEPEQFKSVSLVGFAFECQKLKNIQPKDWDIRLDAVATQSCVYR